MEFSPSFEDPIKDFRVYNNDQMVCELAGPVDRKITSEAELSMGNVFRVVAVEQAGGETSPSNLNDTNRER